MDISYTLDNLVIDFTIPIYSHYMVIWDMFLHDLSKSFNHMRYGELKRDWLSCNVGSFKYNYAFEIEKGRSYYFAYQPNWEKVNSNKIICRLEFNPAKLGHSFQFWNMLNKILSMSKNIDIKRYDLAIDIPIDRKYFSLKKDNRIYTLIQNSDSNKTEYLGKGQNHGRIKLYNKQIESKLPSPLTRLEFTLNGNCDYAEFERVFPDVRIIDNIQIGLELSLLKDTDKVLVLACMDNPTYLTLLGRYKQKKIECILSKYTQLLKPCKKSFENIITEIKKYCKQNCTYSMHEVNIVTPFE